MYGRCIDRFPGRLPDVLDAISRVEQFSVQHRVPVRVVQSLVLALEEVLVNIIVHGYRDEESHVIEMIVDVHEMDIGVEVKDDGIPFDPRTVSAPNLSCPLDDRPIGGLGVWLTLQMMDEVKYQRDGSINRLWLVKRWTSEY